MGGGKKDNLQKQFYTDDSAQGLDAALQELQQAATLCGMRTAPLAAIFVREGMRQRRFPAIDFREGEPGRVAHLAGSGWPV